MERCDRDVETRITQRDQISPPLCFGCVISHIAVETFYFLFAITKNSLKTKPKNQPEYVKRNDRKFHVGYDGILQWPPTSLGFFVVETNDFYVLFVRGQTSSSEKRNTYSKLRCSTTAARSSNSENDDNDPTGLSGHTQQARRSKALVTHCPRQATSLNKMYTTLFLIS